MKVVIKNGLVIDPVNSLKDKLDILIENDCITKIEKNINEDVNYTIDAKGMIVSPGFVDLHANFCDPGATDREDLKTGSLSAAKGGITHVVLGTDNKPAPSESNVIDYINKYASIMPINIYPCAAVTVDRLGYEMADISFLYNHGAHGFYDGLKPIENKNILEKIMLAVKAKNKVLSLYSETIQDVKIRGVIEGKSSKKLNLKGVTPIDSETLDLKDNIALAKLTNCVLDLAYITAPESIDLVEEAKKDGQIIYAEAPALNLILSDKALEKSESLAKVLPPLRQESDRTYLLKAIKKGIIDVVSSNHVPIEEDDKDLKIKDAISGSIGLETLLGICGKVLVEELKMSWKEVIEKISVNPAKIFELDDKGAGTLGIGNEANITIFDPNEKWKLTEENIVSKSHNTPLIGVELIGKVKYTICKGKLVYRDIKINNNTDEKK